MNTQTTTATKAGYSLEKQVTTKPLYLKDTTYTGDRDWEAELEVNAGEEIDVLVNKCSDGRIYYTAFRFKDGKYYTYTHMRQSDGKLIPNCGGLMGSQEVAKYFNK